MQQSIEVSPLELPAKTIGALALYQRPLGSSYSFSPILKVPDETGTLVEIPFWKRLPYVEGFHPTRGFRCHFPKAGCVIEGHLQDGPELFIAEKGRVEITIEDPRTKEQCVFQLCPEDGRGLWIRGKLAHEIRALTDGAILRSYIQGSAEPEPYAMTRINQSANSESPSS